MRSSGYKQIEKGLGIKNNSSESVLRESQIFQDICDCLGKHKYSVQKILDSNENIDDIGREVKEGTFLGYSISELRLFKQALNNIICLAVFQQCIDETQDFGEGEIPFLGYDRETESLHFRPMSIGDFINRKHPVIKMKQKELHESEKYVLTVGRLIQRILLFSKTYRIDSKTAGGYLAIFESILGDFFHDISIECITKKNDRVNQQISLIYFFLEILLKEMQLESHGTYFNSFTSKISLNTNIQYLRRHIYDYSEKNKRVPTIGEIELFLSQQGKEVRKTVNDGHKAHVRNLGFIILDDVNKIYVPDISRPIDDFVAGLGYLGGCPFAKSKVGNNKNALSHMHELTDGWMLKIIKELERSGKYRPYR